MPSVSRARQIVMAIGEHSPDKLYARNKRVANISKSQLHDFASTPRTGLPNHVPKLADGHKPMTNATFQQSERTSGSRPAWMEAAQKHAMNRPAETMANGRRPQLSQAFGSKMPGGFNKPLDSANFGADGVAPKFRVKSVRQVTVAEPVNKPLRKRVYGSQAPMMADGGKWMESAFSKNSGGLHRATHTPSGQKIPVSKVKGMAAHGSAHQKAMANAAINANPDRY